MKPIHLLLTAALAAATTVSHTVVLAADNGPADNPLQKFNQAIADLDRAVKLDPDAPAAYQARGEIHFKAGHIRESIADFDRFLELQPRREPYHWQRGISYYFAGEYEKGVRQFELHKTVNPRDVENAVWHYLCKAKVSGPKKARSTLIEISGDSRPWAMTVYSMYQGKVTPRQALARADQPSETPTQRQDNLFYTHLYVGLYHESMGRSDRALQQIRIAAEDYPSPHYMGDVARVMQEEAIADKLEDVGNNLLKRVAK